jgi:integrase
LIETFLPYSEANKKSFANDVSICRVLVEYFLGKTMRQITPANVEGFKQWFLAKPIVYGTDEERRERKRSLATVNNHLRVLSKIFSLALNAELVDSNPCFKVRKFRPNNRRLRVLSDHEEIELLMKLERNQLVRNIVIFALNTGLRRGEIFNLQWSDVDFERERMIVRKTKSSKERFVPMNSTVRKLLFSMERTSEYVFPSPRKGGRLVDLRKSFSGALREAKIKNFRFHDLRHTFATRLADEGTDIFTLKEILGHAEIKTTMIYVHANGEAGRRAVEKLDAKKHFGPALGPKLKRQVLACRKC